jgi:YHS domain-containing protein
MIRNFRAAALALVCGLAVPAASHAADEVNVSRGLVESGKPLAVHSYDVVAYFTSGRPTVGSSAYEEVYEGATYRFASAENQKAFRGNPEKFAPQFGGYCAFGAAHGKKFDGDPQSWKVVNDKLYLNLNPDVQKKFEQDVPGFITKAEKQWPKIQHSAASDL